MENQKKKSEQDFRMRYQSSQDEYENGWQGEMESAVEGVSSLDEKSVINDPLKLAMERAEKLRDERMERPLPRKDDFDRELE